MRSPAGSNLAEALRATPETWTVGALDARWSRAARRAAARSGAIGVVLPGRYAAAEHRASMLARAHAATRHMGGRSALIGVNAAAHWGLCDADPDRITVSAPHGTSRTQPRWLRIKRTGAVLDVAEAHGVAVARPADAVVTAFGDIPGRDGEEMVLAAVRRGLATCDQLDEAMSRWGALRGRAGVTRAVAAARLGCESVLEVDAARGPFRGPAFADWIRQHRLLLDAIPVRLDMYHAGSRTAIELDGATYHSDPDDVASDRRRDALLAAHGIQVLRFGTRDIRLHAQWCRETALRVAGVRSAA